MSNFDINVDGRTENRTPISHPATSRCDNKRKTVVQSYQDVTFPKHILQSKEPNTNSQVQVLLKLPRYTMFENRFCPECCSFRSVWAGHTDFIENRYCKMAWKIGNFYERVYDIFLGVLSAFNFVWFGLNVAFNLFQSYRDGVWMWQGAQCSLLECCLTEISRPGHFDMIFHPVTLYWHWADQF